MGSVTGFWQKVEYERVPHYCTHCWHVGHAESLCTVHNPELKLVSKETTQYRPKILADHGNKTTPTSAVLHPLQAQQPRHLQGKTQPPVDTQNLEIVVPSNNKDAATAVGTDLSTAAVENNLQPEMELGRIQTSENPTASVIPVAAAFQTVLTAIGTPVSIIAKAADEPRNHEDEVVVATSPKAHPFVASVIEEANRSASGLEVSEIPRVLDVESRDGGTYQQQARPTAPLFTECTSVATAHKSPLVDVADVPAGPSVVVVQEDSDPEVDVALIVHEPVPVPVTHQESGPLNANAVSWSPASDQTHIPATHLRQLSDFFNQDSHTTSLYRDYEENYLVGDEKEDNDSIGEDNDTDKDSYQDFIDSQIVRDDTYLETRRSRRSRREHGTLSVQFRRGRGRPQGSRNRTFFDVVRTVSTRSRASD